MSPGFDYPALLRRATLGMVREGLEQVARTGFPGEHHFFLTFRTGHPGVRLPPALVRQYPETMTIVLQHQFRDLVVEPDAFEVSLRFGGADERLRVPFDALTAFLDPSVPFGLDFTQFGEAAGPESGAPEPGTAGSPPGAPGPPEAGEPPRDGGDVLPFRRKDP